MRGFLSGMIWGGAAIGVGLAALSLMSPVAPRPELRSDAPEAVAATGSPEASGVAAGGRDPDLVEAAPSALEQADRGGDVLADVTKGTAPGEAPSVVAEPDRPAAPEAGTGAESPRAEAGGEVSKMPAPAPQAPPQDEALTAAPVAEPPQPEAQASADVPEPQAEGNSPDAPEPLETPEQMSQAPQMAAQGAPEEAPEVAVRSEPAPAASPEPQAQGDTATAPAPQAPADVPAPEVAEAPSAIAPPQGADAPAQVPTAADPPPRREPEPEAEPEPEPQRQVAALPQAGAAPSAEAEPDTAETPQVAPRIGQRVVPLTERGKPAPEAAVAAVPDAPPLERYAQQFDNPESKPLMAIVLIDDAEAIGIEALAEFPYPLTFALDPTAPDAAEKMARHRDAGFEVVALIDLPRGAAPQDAEVALSAGFDRLPEALAVMEGSGTGVQGSRDLSDQVTAFVGSTGRGLITLGNGLNTMQKLAVRDGVPAAAVFRDFDGAGQTPTVMRRFLDQAAFRAGQEGGVVMLGRVRPDTVSSLLIWGLQDRAGRVALAPVSAVLRQTVAPAQ